MQQGSAIHFWEMHDSEKDAGSKFKRLLPTLLACLHPILSPLVYVYRYQKVRSELKTFLKKKISSLNCCHEKHDPTDCQDFVQQCNNLPHTLPGPSCADAAENLEPPVMSTVDSETIITVDVEYLSASECGAELVAECPSKIQAQVSCHVAHSSVSIQVEEDVRRQECSESDSENQDCREEQVISIETKTKNGLLEYVRCWVSRRWNHHRDSVASTASFITLLSNRSTPSIPSTEIWLEGLHNFRVHFPQRKFLVVRSRKSMLPYLKRWY